MSEPRKYLSENTQNVAGVHVITRASCAPEWQRNDADILFTFVIQGSMALECEGRAPYDLQAGDVTFHSGTTFHYSGANTSPDARPALALAFIETGAIASQLPS